MCGAYVCKLPVRVLLTALALIGLNYCYGSASLEAYQPSKPRERECLQHQNANQPIHQPRLKIQAETQPSPDRELIVLVDARRVKGGVKRHRCAAEMLTSFCQRDPNKLMEADWHPPNCSCYYIKSKPQTALLFGSRAAAQARQRGSEGRVCFTITIGWACAWSCLLTAGCGKETEIEREI